MQTPVTQGPVTQGPVTQGPEECSICQENILSHHNVSTLGGCTHKFHSICIQTWATIGNTCPLCRQVFTDAQDLNRIIPTLMAMSIILPMENQLQRISLAFAFLKHLLQFFPTSDIFNLHKNLIISFAETFVIDNYKIPLLSYTHRADLYRQCSVLRNKFREMNGLNLERHQFVRFWKQRLLSDMRASMFFFQKQLVGSTVVYFPLLQQPHTS
jgi:hypothetical protein